MQKKTKYIIGTLITLFLVSNLLIGWPLVPLYNNYLSSKFLSNLENSTLPNNSKVIDGYKKFGLLYGNGNHCDCEVGVVIESDMEIKGFENYIKNSLSVNAPMSDSEIKFFDLYYVNKTQLFNVENGGLTEFLDDGSRYADELENYNAIKKLIETVTQKEGKNYFVITAYDQVRTGLNMKDIRCH